MAGCAGPLRAVADGVRAVSPLQRVGTWQRSLPLQAQAEAKGFITWDVSVDSTVARTHQHAVGVWSAQTRM